MVPGSRRPGPPPPHPGQVGRCGEPALPRRSALLPPAALGIYFRFVSFYFPSEAEAHRCGGAGGSRLPFRGTPRATYLPHAGKVGRDNQNGCEPHGASERARGAVLVSAVTGVICWLRGGPPRKRLAGARRAAALPFLRDRCYAALRWRPAAGGTAAVRPAGRGASPRVVGLRTMRWGPWNAGGSPLLLYFLLLLGG